MILLGIRHQKYNNDVGGVIIVLICNRYYYVIIGLRVSISWIKNRCVGTARVRRGGSCIQQFTNRRHRSIVCDIWRKRSWQNGNHQIHSPIFVLGDQQRQHMGRTADT